MTPASQGQETNQADRQTHGVPWPGLSEVEARDRWAAGQGNVMAFVPTRTYGQILRDNALSPINTVIFAIGAALLLMGLVVDALVTVGIVLLNVVAAVLQEGRAKRQLDRIALLTRPTATVIRDGRARTIDPAEIVVGDVLIAQTGDQILADGLIRGDGSVEIDESLLSGESEAVAKRPGDPVSSGSFCVVGTAIYEAQVVGAAGFANRLTAEARAFRQVKTPIQRAVDLVLRVMVVLILAIAGPVVLDLAIRALALLAEAVDAPLAATLHRAYQDYSVEERVRSVAVVAGLVPQGMSLMLTTAYALGALRLAGKGALLQHANATESLSHVDVLCLDKTGTLTTNRLAFDELRPLATAATHLADILGDYAASATAQNRTLAALVAAFPASAKPVRTEVPFSSVRKWSAIAFEDPARPGFYVLGAPEVLQPLLQPRMDMGASLTELTATGRRVLLLAYHPRPVSLPSGEEPLLPANLTPLGLVSLADEIQPAVRETIDALRRAGIRPIIISGDNPDTVAALARQAGFGQDGALETASGLDLTAGDDNLSRTVEETTIFGRIAPEQKRRIVQALQRNGHYVAMVGDGVNDIPALKRAEVAIAMQSGSQATRAVADVVLLGDSFAVLPAAFREGQRIVRSSQDLMKLFLARSLAMVLMIVGVAIVGGAFPVTPRLSAVPAFLVIGVPTLALTVWARPGTTTRQVFRSVLPFALLAALTIAPVGLTLYLSYLRAAGSVALARTVVTVAATLCGLVLIPFVAPPRTTNDNLSGDLRPSLLALVLTALLALILAAAPLRSFFELTPLAPRDVSLVALTVAVWALTLRAIWRHDLARRFLALTDDTTTT